MVVVGEGDWEWDYGGFVRGGDWGGCGWGVGEVDDGRGGEREVE